MTNSNLWILFMLRYTSSSVCLVIAKKFYSLNVEMVLRSSVISKLLNKWEAGISYISADPVLLIQLALLWREKKSICRMTARAIHVLMQSRCWNLALWKSQLIFIFCSNQFPSSFGKRNLNCMARWYQDHKIGCSYCHASSQA